MSLPDNKESMFDIFLKGNGIYEYYNSDREEYNKSQAYSQKRPPDMVERATNKKNKSKSKIKYLNEIEEIFEMESDDSIDLSLELDPEKLINNFQKNINDILQSNETICNNSIYIKDNLKKKLIDVYEKITHINSSTFAKAKSYTNPFNDIIEDYFFNKSSYVLANINSRYKFELIQRDNLYEYSTMFICGDNGGFCDYINGLQK